MLYHCTIMLLIATVYITTLTNLSGNETKHRLDAPVTILPIYVSHVSHVSTNYNLSNDACTCTTGNSYLSNGELWRVTELLSSGLFLS